MLCIMHDLFIMLLIIIASVKKATECYCCLYVAIVQPGNIDKYSSILTSCASKVHEEAYERCNRSVTEQLRHFVPIVILRSATF